MSTKDMRELARRAHVVLQQRRRNLGARVPVSSDLSRILENDPSYQPYRPRARRKERKPVTNPGIFTVQRIARDLGTTVGNLLGEPAAQPASESLTPDQRQTLRDAIRIITEVFDLNDPKQ